MENLELDADFWISCVECFEEYGNEDQILKVGLEIDSNSLIVNCQKHEEHSNCLDYMKRKLIYCLQM